MGTNKFWVTVYRRERSKNWQIQFRDATGFSLQKSSGASNKPDAYTIAADWQKNGIPQDKTGVRRPVAEAIAIESLIESIRHGSLNQADAQRIVEALVSRKLINVRPVSNTDEDISLVAFLEKFWNFEKSPYVKEKLAHGHRISKRHCKESLNRIKYWRTAYPELLLADLSIEEVNEFPLILKEKGLSTSSIVKIVLVCSTAIAWAKRTGLIDRDPFEGTMRFSETHEKRGILTEDEVMKLFDEGVWPDERTRLASLLSCTTALRSGECRAVQVQDLIPGSERTGGPADPSEKGYRPDQLYVWAWSDVDQARKQPKNGENRMVPLHPEVYNALLALADANPFGKAPGTFIFYNSEKDRPIRTDSLIRDLAKALESIGIDNEARLERNIDFHSWRHYYSTKMSSLVASNKIRLVTGHKSASVFQGYSDHVNESDIREVANAGFNAFSAMFPKENPAKIEHVS